MSSHPPRPRFVRLWLAGTAALAFLTATWSVTTYHGELRAPHLLIAGYWLAFVAILLRARWRTRRAVVRKLAVVRSPRRARIVTLRFEDGVEARHLASHDASVRASEGTVGVATLRNGTLTWFEPLDVTSTARS